MGLSNGIKALGVALALIAWPTATAQAAPPLNDAFPGAVMTTSPVVATTVDATGQPGEPAHSGTATVTSAWYTWTAPHEGTATFTTCSPGTNYDTILAVYSGNAVDALTLVVQNDDVGGTPCPTRANASQVTFPATAGQVFRIAVDGFGAATGQFELRLSMTPPTFTPTPTPAPPPTVDAGPRPAPRDTVKPRLTQLGLSPAIFEAANYGSAITAAVGGRVTYRLSEAATSTFGVESRRPGRKKGRRCVTPGRSRKGKRCLRYVKVRGSFTHVGTSGLNSFRFLGRLGRRALKPGGYRLFGVAKDAAGNRSAAVRIRFTVTKP